MKMAMDENNKVKYKFYKKPMANKYTMMANSAVSDRVKRSTMTNEAMRRLLCCSENLNQSTRDEIMEFSITIITILHFYCMYCCKS